MNIVINKSDNPNNKFMAVIDNKKIHFGDSRYSDYTKHKDPERKKHIYQDIKMIILRTYYIHHSTLLICCGIKQH